MSLIEIRAKEVLDINNGDKDKAIQFILKTKGKGFAAYDSNKRKKKFWEDVMDKIKNTIL